MKPNSVTREITPADIAAIHARAQQMRAEAMADMIRAMGRSVARGWVSLARRSQRRAH